LQTTKNPPQLLPRLPDNLVNNVAFHRLGFCMLAGWSELFLILEETTFCHLLSTSVGS
jgi:hypothetical protein